MYRCGTNLTLKDEKSIFIDDTVIIGDNVTIYENTRLEGYCVIGNGAIILRGCHMIDTKIGANSVIDNTKSESAVVGENCSVGPYARLRKGAVIKDEAKIGNFVEIKNATIGKGTKVSHLAYVGDAEVGNGCNIGCGAIFVNYNGKTKSRTKIGNNVFIGSNCNLIAPVNIDDNSYVCAGTTVTEDVKSDDFVIGRVRQQVKENRAHKYLKEFIGD